tara:strand:+ start:733 stop:987 length:255 start_codon:yes stop_codon:yes gene_type:complete
MTDDDFRRLESKVDKLTDAVGKLILFEERQANQGERIGAVETKIGVHEVHLQRIDKKVDQWVNRGVGVWAAAAVVFALVKYLEK